MPGKETGMKSGEGCDAGFEALYRRYRGRVFGTVYGIVRDRRDAEELTEEVFVRAAGHPQALARAGPDPGGWLYRVARNVSLDRLRRRRAHPEPLSLDRVSPDLGPSCSGPAEEFEQRREQEKLWKAVEQLPAAQRRVVVCRYRDGLSWPETARAMGCAESWVRRLRVRALVALRRQLG